MEAPAPFGANHPPYPQDNVSGKALVKVFTKHACRVHTSQT